MTSMQIKAESPRRITFRTWRTELLFAIPVVSLVAWLFYSWYAVRNRYLIFLYFHDMGSGFDTSPFGWVTVSRYWMSGLVAAGAVMLPYIAANLVLGRLVRGYRAPVWWRLWLLCAVPLAVVIPFMVMTLNNPVLPLLNAIQVTVVLLAGMALAVALGQQAAGHPAAYALLMADGFAVACLLMSLRALEFDVVTFQPSPEVRAAMGGAAGATLEGETAATIVEVTVDAVRAALADPVTAESLAPLRA